MILLVEAFLFLASCDSPILFSVSNLDRIGELRVLIHLFDVVVAPIILLIQLVLLIVSLVELIL